MTSLRYRAEHMNFTDRLSVIRADTSGSGAGANSHLLGSNILEGKKREELLLSFCS